MTKHKFFIDYSKEEAWLRGMAVKGWLFTARTSFGYRFAQAQPSEQNYRIDYRAFKSRTDFTDYITLFADSGWQHVAGSKNSGAQYFVQAAPDADEDIFSDSASRAGRYRRSSEVWLSLLMCYSVLFTGVASTGAIEIAHIFNFKALYYTPGLWQMSGFSFWRAFLFETPFALGRGFSWLLLLIMIGVFLFMAIKTMLAAKAENHATNNRT